MPTSQMDPDSVAIEQDELRFLIDMPGFALVSDPLEGGLEYSWVPAQCPPEIVEGLLSTLGLQEAEVWGDPAKVVYARVVEREEMNAEN